MAEKSIWLAQFSLFMENKNISVAVWRGEKKRHFYVHTPPPKKRKKKKINASLTFRASRLERW